MKKLSDNQSKAKKKVAAASSLRLALENRLLFDGAVVATAAQVMDDKAAAGDHCSKTFQDSKDISIAETGGDSSKPVADLSNFFTEKNSLQPQSANTITATCAGTKGAANLIIVDPRAEGIHQLLEKPPVNTEIQLLKPEKDGFEQIHEILRERKNTENLHIQTGEIDGKICLGNSFIYPSLTSVDKLNVTGWGDYFNDNTSVTFYGENAPAGPAWLNHIEALTGGKANWHKENLLDNKNTSDGEKPILNDSAVPVQPDEIPTILVFIDTSVADYQDLLKDIDPNATVILLDANRNGVEQIANEVANYDDIAAIHIISHGSTGQLQLGTAVLDQNSMQSEYADELASLNSHLSENADIQVYGCNFGRGTEGEQAANLLARLTGADIAASTNDTGHSTLGGDWVLERQTGSIESSVAITFAAQSAFQQLLATGQSLDWDVAVLPNLSTDVSYAISTVNLRLTSTNNDSATAPNETSNFANSGGNQVTTSGTSTNGRSVAFSNNIANTVQSTTMEFSQTVTNLKFSLYDVDNSEGLLIQAFNGNTLVNISASASAQNSSASTFNINGSGNNVQLTGKGVGFNSVDNTNNGTVNFNIAGPVTRIIITETSGQVTYALSDITIDTPNAPSTTDTNQLQLNWSQVDFTANSLNQTFTVNNPAGQNVTVNFATSGNTANLTNVDDLSNVPNQTGTFPTSGAIGTNSNGEALFIRNNPIAPGETINETISFSTGVADLRFSVFDFDGDLNNFSDTVKITGFINGVAVNPVFEGLSKGSTYGFSGNTISAHLFSDGVDPADLRGAVQVYFASKVDKVVITYSDSQSVADPGAKSIGISNLHFAAPVNTQPQIDLNVGDEGGITNAVGWMHNNTSLPNLGTVNSSAIVASAGNETNGTGITRSQNSGDTFYRVSGADQSSYGGALANNDYVQTSFTTSTSMPANTMLSAFTFSDWDLSTGYKVAVEISSDNFASKQVLASDLQAVVSGSQGNPATTFYDINNFALTSGTTYQVRVYIYGADNVSGTLVFDDFQLYTQTVPINNTVTFNENGPAVNVADSADALVSDQQDNITRLTITANANPDGAADVVTVAGRTFPLNGNSTQTATIGSTTFSIAYDASNRTFTVTNNAGSTSAMSQTDLQSLVRGVTYQNNSDTPTTTARTLTFTATDAYNLSSKPAIATINITPVNDQPLIDLNSAATTADGARDNTVTFTENGTAVNVASGSADVNDFTENDLARMNINLAGFVNGVNEVIKIGTASFPQNANSTQTVTVGGTTFSVAYTTATNAGSFVITRNGGGVIPQADIDALVRSITYVNNGDTPTAGNRTMTFTVTDNASSTSPSAVATINVVAVNDAPVAAITTTVYSATHDANLNLKGTGLSVSDVDAGPGQVTVTLSVGSGILNVTAGSSGATVSNSGTSSVTISGTLAQINALLGSDATSTVTYNSNANLPPASTTLTLQVNDNGNAGIGGVLVGSDTATINITVINEKPSIDLDNDTFTKPVAITDPTLSTADWSLNNAVNQGTATNNFSVSSVSNGGNSGAALQIDKTFTGSNGQTSNEWIQNTTNKVDPNLSPFQSINLQADVKLVSGVATNAQFVIYQGNNIFVSNIVKNLTSSFSTFSLTNVTASSFSALAGNGNTGPLDFSRNGAPMTFGLVFANQITQGAGTFSASMLADNFNISFTTEDVDFATSYTENTPPVKVSASDAIASDNQNNITSLKIETGSFLNGANEIVNIGGVNFPFGTDVTSPVTVTAGASSFRLTFIGGVFNIVDNDIANPKIANSDLSTLIQGITYQNNSENPTAGVRTLTFTATDIFNLSSPSAVSRINVVPVNDAPVAVNNDCTATEAGGANNGTPGSNATGNVLANDTDVDTPAANLVVTEIRTGAAEGSGTPGTIGSPLAGQYGSLTLNSNGGYTYVVDDNNPLVQLLQVGQVHTETFNYTVSDGSGGTDTAVLTIIINGANDAPVALNDGVFTTNQNSAVTTVNVLTNDSDVDNTLTPASITSFTATSANGGAVVNNGNGTFTYTPAAGYFGTDTFTYTITDAGGLSSTATVTINIVAINETPVNTVPRGTLTIAEDVRTFITGVQVSDPDESQTGSPVSHLISTVQLSVSNGTLNVNPAGGATITGNDSGTLTLSGTQTAINATLTSLSYLGNPNNFGGDTLVMISRDGQGLTDSDTVVINVAPVNDPPSGQDATRTLNEDSTYTFNRGDFGFTDAPGEGNNFLEVVINPPTNGTLTLNGSPITVPTSVPVGSLDSGQLRFTPAANASGNAYATIDFQVRDDGGIANGGVDTDPTPNRITFNINPINENPVNTVPRGTLTIAEDVRTFITGVQVSDPDESQTGSPVSHLISTVQLSVSNGTLNVNPAGGATITGNDSGILTLSGIQTAINATLTSLSYLGNPNNFGGDTLVMISRDGQGLTDSDTVVINVAPVNDPPSGQDATRTLNEDSTYTFNRGDFGFTDAPGEGNNFLEVVINPPTNGTLTLNGSPITVPTSVPVGSLDSGQLRFTPAANASGNAYATIDFQVRDDGGTANGGVDTDPTPNRITFNINPINENPVNTVPRGTLTIAEDVRTFITGVQVSDPDESQTGSPVSHLISTVQLSVSNGTLNVNPAGGATITGNDSGILTLSGTQTAINATLTSLSYLGNPNNFGGDTLVMISRDGQGLTDSDTVVINVAPVNDPPSGQDATRTLNEDSTYTFNRGDFGFTDAPGEGNNFLEVVINPPTNGTLTLNGSPITVPTSVPVGSLDSGQLRFTPAANASGNAYATIDFQVRDDGGTTNGGIDLDPTPNRITFNVTPVNDVPVAVNDTATTDEDTALTLSPATLLANDTGLGDGPVTITSVQGAVNGSVALVGGNIVFTPTANYNGPASFTYTITDANGDTSTATVNVTVTPVNDLPVAVLDTATTAEDTPVVIRSATLLANDTGLGDGPVTVTSVQDPVNGTVALVGGNIVFTPAANYNGPASFTYTITDANGDTSTATVNVTVTPVNDLPVAVLDTATTAEDTPVVIRSATLLANDTGLGDGPVTVTSVQDPVNGTVALVGGNVVFTPDPDYNGPASFTYTLTDANGDSSTATVTLTIIAINDPIEDADETNEVTEDTPLIVTTAAGLLANTTAADGSARVTSYIIPGLIGIQLVDKPVSIPNVGTLIINGDGSYSFTPLPNYIGSIPVINYTVTDDDGSTAASTLTLTIIPVNDFPVAVLDTATTAEDTPVVISAATLLGNDTGLGDGPVTVTSVQAPVNGTVTLVGGNIVFTPAANYNGPASFTYTITDANGDTSTATVNVTVTPVNDVPVAVNDTATTDEDTALTLSPATLLANDTGLGDGPVTITSVQGAVNGSVALVGGNIVFTPAANYNGPASFTYTITDANGDTSTATVNVTVTPVNDLPVAVLDTATTAEDTPVVIRSATLLANDTGLGDGPVTVTSVQDPVNGTVALVGGNVVFTPDPDYNGPASFTYTLTDANGDSSTATVTLTIIAINDPIEDADETNEVTEDTPLIVTTAAGLLANTTAADGSARVTSYIIPGLIGIQLVDKPVSIPNVGTLIINGDGSYSFTPLPNYIGSIPVINYTVTDDDGSTAASTLTLTIIPVNDFPVAVLDTATTAEDTPVVISAATLLGNDTGLGDGPVTVTSVQASVNGTVTLVGGNIVFTPAANYNGPASFTYTITDANGDTSTATVNVTVTPVNDVPVAVNDTATTDEDTALTLSPATLLANDTGLGDGPVTITSVQGAVNGSVALVGGNIVFTPAANYNGPASFTYTITDANGDTSTATVNVTVTPVNDVPVAVNDTATTDEDTALTLSPATLLANDTGLGDGPVTITSVQGAVNGSVALVGGNIVFTPAANYNGPASFTYTITDANGDTSTATVNVTVTPVNDLPVAVLDTATTAEDTPVVIRSATLLANDTGLGDGPVTVTSVQDTVNGIVALVGGNIVFTPAANYNGPASFTYTITDANGDTSTATVNVTVTPVNDLPVAVLDTATTAEDTPVVIRSATLLANDTGLGDGPVTVTSVQDPVNGTVALVGGNVVFTPDPDYNGPASFTYTLTDANGDSSTATVTLTIIAINDPIEDADETNEVTEDTPLIVTTAAGLLANTTAADGSARVTSYIIPGLIGIQLVDKPVSIPNVGTLIINGDGSYSFTPLPNYIGSIPVINYTVTDDDGSTAASTLTLTIIPVNDFPVAVLDTATTAEDTPVVISAATLLGNDTGLGDGPVTVTSVQAPVNGTVTLVGGNIVFTPAANYNGPASFTYTITDANGDSSTATVNVAVIPVIDPPVAISKRVNSLEDVNVPVKLTGADLDGTVEFVTMTQLPTIDEGTLFLAGTLTPVALNDQLTAAEAAQLVFVPVINYNSTSGDLVEIEFTVQDNDGADSTPGTFVIDVAGVNDDPLASPSIVSGPEDNPVPVSLSGIDPDGPITKVTIINLPSPSEGVLTFANGTPVKAGESIPAIDAQNLVFVPALNFIGNIDVPFTVTDSEGQVSASPALLTILILPDNDVPQANDDGPIVTKANTPATGNLITGQGGGQTDTDADGDPLSVTQFTVDTNGDGTPETIIIPSGGVGVTVLTNAAGQTIGILRISSNGTFNFTPALAYDGPVPSAVYTISDGVATDTATLSFLPVPNTAPVANSDGPIPTNFDSPTKGNVLTGVGGGQADKDADGDELTVTQFTIPNVGSFPAGTTAIIPGVGTMVISPNGNYIFTPDLGYTGSVPKVTYTISDGTSTDSAVLSFTPIGDSNIGALIILSNPVKPLNPSIPGGGFEFVPLSDNVPLINNEANPSFSLYGNLQDCDLYLTLSPRNQVVMEMQSYTFYVPLDTFCHCKPNEDLEYKATRPDGTPLPKWLNYDAKNMKFSGVPPKGAHNTVVRLTATDRYGNQAHGIFTVFVKEKDHSRNTHSHKLNLTHGKFDHHVQLHENSSLGLTGKAGFSEQIGNGKLSRLMESRALLDSLSQL